MQRGGFHLETYKSLRKGGHKHLKESYEAEEQNKTHIALIATTHFAWTACNP